MLEAMEKIILIISLFAYTFAIEAQDIARNNIYLELGGPAYLHSINYERLLSKNQELNFPFRIGFFDLSSTTIINDANYGIPLSLSIIKKIKSKKYWFLELKAITTITYTRIKVNTHFTSYNYTSINYIPGISFGYKRQPPVGWFYFHFHFQLTYEPKLEGSVCPWLSAGLGTTF